MPRQRKRAAAELTARGARLYGVSDARDLIPGTTVPQIQHWVRSGAVRPDEKAAGHGHHRGFSFRNLCEIAIARELAAWGVPPPSMGVVIAAIREADPDRDAHLVMPHAERERARLRRGGLRIPDPPTDAEIKAVVDADLRACGWTEASLAQAAVTEERMRIAWRAFKNPTTRTLAWEPVLIVRRDPFTGLLRGRQDVSATDLASSSQVVINVGTLIIELELATGFTDHWGKESAAL